MLVRFEENQEWISAQESKLHEALGVSSSYAVGSLDRNMSRGSRSGTKYDYLPYTSSTNTEFPQEQSGNLRSSIGMQEVGKLDFAVGFFYEFSNKEHYMFQEGIDVEPQLVSIGENEFGQMVRWFEFDRNFDDYKPLFGTFEGAGSDVLHSFMIKEISNMMRSR